MKQPKWPAAKWMTHQTRDRYTFGMSYLSLNSSGLRARLPGCANILRHAHLLILTMLPFCIYLIFSFIFPASLIVSGIECITTRETEKLLTTQICIACIYINAFPFPFIPLGENQQHHHHRHRHHIAHHVDSISFQIRIESNLCLFLSRFEMSVVSLLRIVICIACRGPCWWIVAMEALRWTALRTSHRTTTLALQ